MSAPEGPAETHWLSLTLLRNCPKKVSRPVLTRKIRRLVVTLG